MATYGDHVGLRFHQKGSGKLSPVAGAPSASPHFRFDMVLEAPSLRAFLEGARHEAPTTGGTVWWGDGSYPIESGRMELFRRDANDPKRKYYDITFRFTGPEGTPFLFFAQKKLHDDGWLDLFDAAADLTRLENETLSDARSGQVLFKGQLNVHLDETISELASMEVLHARDEAEKAAAQSAFPAFFNWELASIYSGVPLLIGAASPLSWGEQVAVQLMADALLPEGSVVKPPEVLRAVESFVATARPPLLEKVRLALGLAGTALGLVRPERQWLRRECHRLLHGDPSPLRDAVELMHAMVTVPYYSDPRVSRPLGFDPDARPSDPPTPDLPEVEAPRGPYDFVIAGSGPAGALLAHRLTAAGRRVLLLEAGRQHTTLALREMEALAGLYKQGGLQRASDTGAPAGSPRSLTVLEGEALGGGGLVNNAVCFRLPPEVRAHWRSEAVGFPFSDAELDRAYDVVARELSIGPASGAMATGKRLNPTAEYLRPAFGAALKETLVAIQGCQACGCCNIGCVHGAKRNGLTVYLPQAASTGRLDILTGARVERLVTAGGRVSYAVVRLAKSGKTLEVTADHYVLAAGPVGSSLVLHHTEGLTAAARKRVGQGLSANIGTPVHAFARRAERAVDALAMAQWYRPEGAGYLVETWFNPPASHSMAMPGFLDEHLSRMGRYAHMLSAGVLTGTAATGTVEKDGDLTLPIRDVELRRLATGVGEVAEAFLSGGTPSPVEEVLVPTRLGIPLRSVDDVRRFKGTFKELRSLGVNTGHPQGGNAMSAREDIRVVDTDFRVQGLQNAFVCDASVFPACATVNPQWTVLALAHLAAEKLARLG